MRKGLLLILTVLLGTMVKAQGIYKSTGVFPETGDDNELLSRLGVLMSKENSQEGFAELIQTKKVSSVRRFQIAGKYDLFSVVDLRLSEDRGNVYKKHLYIIRSLKSQKFFYSNADTLITLENSLAKNFVILYTLKDKLFSQRFSISKAQLFADKERLIWKNSDCEYFNSDKKMKGSVKDLQPCIDFEVVNECKDNYTRRIRKRI